MAPAAVWPLLLLLAQGAGLCAGLARPRGPHALRDGPRLATVAPYDRMASEWGRARSRGGGAPPARATRARTHTRACPMRLVPPRRIPAPLAQA